MRKLIVASVLALLLSVGAGCGSDDSGGGGGSGGAQSGATKPVSVDVSGKTVDVEGPIKLAYFAPGANNSWLQAAIKGAEESIDKIPGASIEVFDANWDAQTQFNQVQNALQSKRFNAAMIDPVDTQLMCKIMTETAPAQGMLVASITHPLCSLYGESGEDRYVPGTLTYVDANDTVEELQAYLEDIAEQNPGAQQVAIVAGPPADGMTKNVEEAVANIEKSGDHPDFDVTDIITTDFSLTQAQEKVSSLLQANEDLSIIFSPATSDVTRGVYAAIQGAQREDDVAVYEKGGSEWVVGMVKDGKLAGTQPQYPYSNTEVAVEQLAKAFKGEQVPRFVADYGVKYSAADQKRGFQFFDQENIDSYDPEY